MQDFTRLLLSLLVILIVGAGCKKEDKAEFENPFDDPALRPPPENPDTSELEPGSFAYLHKYVFQPTCANSGCHDGGEFPPDFRTIYSSYNTLVYQKSIQIDQAQRLKYRVEPNNAQNSLLHERLTVFMPNTSGIMPLVVDSGSDWEENKEMYIQYIIDWINDGAKDMFGNTPGSSGLNPQVIGLKAFHTGETTTPLKRTGISANKPIGIPNTPIDLWFAFDDDQTPVSQLTIGELQISRVFDDFSQADKYTLQSSGPITNQDFYNNSVDFTHKVTVDFPLDTIGTYFYMKISLQDPDHSDPVLLPSEGASDLTKSFFTLKVDSL